MDQAYNLKYNGSYLEHKYGDQVRIFQNPVSQSLLAQMCRPEVMQPMLNIYVEKLYLILFEAMVNELYPRHEVTWDTRMKAVCPQGEWNGEVLHQATRSVVVDLARAGTWPSHVCFNYLSILTNPAVCRQDHFYINRRTNTKGEVIGVDVSGSKIGGDQDQSIVIFPDPMAATGGSLSHCVSHYKDQVKGKALFYVALHLIITPEYIARMKKDHPDVQIFALRLDRGLSAPEVLSSIPGTYPDKECGLTDHQYIVPGAGGVGEILNNSFV